MSKKPFSIHNRGIGIDGDYEAMPEPSTNDPGVVRAQTTKYFDLIASTGLYASREEIFSRFFQKRNKYIARDIQKMGITNVRILDVACGEGSSYLNLEKLFCGFSVTYKGIDYSAKMVEETKKKGLDVDKGDMVDLSRFPDGSFDAVMVLAGSFCFLPTEKERITALKEMRRVLSDRGSLMLDVFVYSQQMNIEYALEDDTSTIAWMHLFKEGDLERLLESQNFNILTSFSHTSPNKTKIRKNGPNNYHEFYFCNKRT